LITAMTATISTARPAHQATIMILILATLAQRDVLLAAALLSVLLAVQATIYMKVLVC